MYRNFLKPLLDYFVSFLILLLVLPLLFLCTIALILSNKGKAFFVQPRPGMNGKIFNLIKFKTMSDAKDSRGHLLPDKDRITPIGRIIRASSLDELPQLINVLKGDMSLIGPRPLLVKYLPLYNDFQMRRHEVKPGITGLAQINGRNAISWNKKFELDVWYVDNQSFRLDLGILLKTLLKVIKKDGINSSTTETMQPFDKAIKHG